MDESMKEKILSFQKNEITEHHIYNKLGEVTEDEHNRDILQRIGREEKKHHDFWKEYTEEEVSPNRLKIWFYYLLSRIFGVTFGIRLMELGEEDAQESYAQITGQIPEAEEIIEDEDEHEDALLDMLDEDKLVYMGSIVRGLNDALVELTGALAGLTFVLVKTDLIAMTGLITGIAASLSMGGSEYLGSKSEEGIKDPRKASVYTGLSYLITVLFLIFPYFILSNVYFSLAFMIINAMIVILLFTFYISVAKRISFKRRFGEMVGISLGIAALTFVIGFLVRAYFGVEV